MFERTLQDLIRGLRSYKGASKAQEDVFIAEAVEEIREELKGKDMALKAEGVIKMCYLMMLYPIPPPAGFAFHVVEVMSSPRYHLKQLGYLAAPMAFSGDTEEVVLTVNGIKKDLLSPMPPLPPLPLTTLPQMLSLSPSLSTSLHPDLLHLLTHSSARIRKRAVLCLLPCWEAFPEGLREGFPRMRERLQDSDQGVVGATVGVVMELARRQGGKNYLPLAPELFGILTGSSNNWMLIKVVKLFAIITPLEPRLVRKLLPPITSLISSTSAISLLYECVRTCIVGGMLDPDRPESDALARVCVEKLGGYLRDEGGDQNLRYIALLAMVKIIPTHPQMVAEYQSEILESLDDPDVSIRMRALDLLTSMVDSDNLQTIADTLLSHLAPQESAGQALPSASAALAAISSGTNTTGAAAGAAASKDPSTSPAYRHLLTTRLLHILSYNTFANVTDFEFVLSVLIDITYISHVGVGLEIKRMVLDIVGRVGDVRGYAVGVLDNVLTDEGLRERVGDEDESADGLLEAAIFVCGEYPFELSSPLSTVSNLLLPFSSPTLTSFAIQAIAKIFGFYCTTVAQTWSSDVFSETSSLVESISSGLVELEAAITAKDDIELLERLSEVRGLLSFVSADLENHIPPPPTSIRRESIPEMEGGFADPDQDQDNASKNPTYPKSLYIFPPLFTSHPLPAVHPNAQSSVRVPAGLDLEREIVPGGGWPSLEEYESEDEKAEAGGTETLDLGIGGGEGMEELRRVLREGRKKKGKGKGKVKEGETAEEKAERARKKAARRAEHRDDPYYLYDKEDEEVDHIPIVKLDLDSSAGEVNGSDPQPPQPQQKLKLKSKKKPQFDRTGELPEGASPFSSSISPSLGGQSSRPSVSVSRTNSGLADIDLSQPIPASSRLPSRFEEYRLDEDDDTLPAHALNSATAPDAGAGEVNNGVSEGADTPVESIPEVQVVKVKKKKKRGGEKRVKKEKHEDAI